MEETLKEFSHQELSVLLFALEGREEIAKSESSRAPSCEEACPVVENLEELFGSSSLSPEKQLARHLSNHLREALIECGMFEVLAAQASGPANAVSTTDPVKMREINERLKQWRCEIKLAERDRQTLYAAVSRLPRSAWISMPRTLWRLRKKLR